MKYKPETGREQWFLGYGAYLGFLAGVVVSAIGLAIVIAVLT